MHQNPDEASSRGHVEFKRPPETRGTQIREIVSSLFKGALLNRKLIKSPLFFISLYFLFLVLLEGQDNREPIQPISRSSTEL